jgi:hypothetical protein
LPVRLVVLAALLVAAIAPSSAQAARSITIGNGSKPGVAVDGAGTAYIAWYGPESNISTLRFCRLPRGAGACDIAHNITTPGTSLSRPFVTVSGSTVRVASYRYGFPGTPFAQVYEFTSTDGGANFDSGHPIGSEAFDEGVQGPGDTLSVATNASSEGLVFQNMPLGGGSTGEARAVLSSDHPYNGSVGLVDAGTPLVVFANGASFAQFRRYDRSGSINDAANWTPAADIGYADYARLAGGPSGLFMIAGTETNAIVARKYDGNTFTPGVTIAPSGGDDAQQHLTQDAAGRLHAVFPRGDADGLHVAYATSDNGTDWDSADLLTVRDGGIAELRVAVAPDHLGVAAWSTRVNSGPNAGAIDVRIVQVGPTAKKPAGRLPSKPPATARRLKSGAVRFAIAGKLKRPSSVTATQGCRGKISVTVKRGKRVIFSKTLAITKKCVYRKATTLKPSKVGKVRRLTMTLRFKGNAALAAARRSYKVKVK